MSKRTLRTLLLLLLIAGSVPAQELPGVAPGDEPAVPGPWTWFGDFMLREDRVTDIPRATDTSFTRTFGRGRFGVLYDPIPALEFGAAIKLADASNSNDLDRSHNSNERSNDIALDQFFLRWRVGEDASVKLIGDPRVLTGHVESIAYGIEDQNRTTSSELLAFVNPTFSWVRLAQRIPVRIKLDNVPPDLLLVAGRTATVSIGRIGWW